MDLETRDLLSKVAESHGLASWQKIKRLIIDLEIRGNILLTKFQSPHTRSLQIIVDTQKIHLTMHPFPKKGIRGIFSDCYLQLETDNGEIISKRNICYDKKGKVPVKIMWDALDLLYFFGYALWNYSMSPFVFHWPKFKCQKLEDFQHKGNSWQKLQVTFPINFPTHCRTQVFYFCEQGLLRRLDYVADIFNPMARAAHYCLDYKKMGNLMFATHRVVYWRMYSLYHMPYFKAMEGWIKNVDTE